MKSKTSQNNKKTFSLAFLLGIPCCLLLSLLNFINLGMLIKAGKGHDDIWMFFGLGALLAFCLTISLKLPRLRVFIHEIKHAAIIILTGNKLTGFKVDKHTGHVSYSLHKDKLKFTPLISVAPYFLPLFSMPCLLLCLIFESNFRMLFAGLLGFSLFLDILLGFQEIHPHQTDITKMFGGILTVGLFIVTAQLMWSSLCLIWVSGGMDGYMSSAETTWLILKELASFAVNR